MTVAQGVEQTEQGEVGTPSVTQPIRDMEDPHRRSLPSPPPLPDSTSADRITVTSNGGVQPVNFRHGVAQTEVGAPAVTQPIRDVENPHRRDMPLPPGPPLGADAGAEPPAVSPVIFTTGPPPTGSP